MVTEEASEGEMAIEGYSPILAAQVAAVLLINEGGSMEKIKLVKLLYMVERESVRLRSRPVFYDENFSLPHGPAGTNAIDGINGKRDKRVWRKYTEAPDKDEVVRVAKGLRNEDFGDLSDSDIGIIDELSTRFRHLDGDGMRAWTHEAANIPEYQETTKERRPITDEALAKALDLWDAREYAEHVAELRTIRLDWPT